MAGWLITIIDLLTRLLIILLIVQVVLSFVLPPYHPVRQRIDRLVDPLLSPIRKRMPNTGAIDFSPLVLIILVQILDIVLIRLIGWLFTR